MGKTLNYDHLKTEGECHAVLEELFHHNLSILKEFAKNQPERFFIDDRTQVRNKTKILLVVARLLEIKDKVPAVDEELVEKILIIGMNHKAFIRDNTEDCNYIEKRKEAKAEIRKLLPQQVSVTREEIEECFNHQCYIIENIIRLLKSKGVLLKGEK